MTEAEARIEAARAKIQEAIGDVRALLAEVARNKELSIFQAEFLLLAERYFERREDEVALALLETFGLAQAKIKALYDQPERDTPHA